VVIDPFYIMLKSTDTSTSGTAESRDNNASDSDELSESDKLSDSDDISESTLDILSDDLTDEPGSTRLFTGPSKTLIAALTILAVTIGVAIYAGCMLWSLSNHPTTSEEPTATEQTDR
jgi:hypothetical protein